jgi:hypothetical protein
LIVALAPHARRTSSPVPPGTPPEATLCIREALTLHAPSPLGGEMRCTADRGMRRLELIPAAAPQVEAALAAADLQADDRLLQMAATGDTRLTPRRPDGVVLALALAEEGDDSLLLAIATVQNSAYGELRPPQQSDVERLRRCRARGGLLAAARDAAGGEAIGAGLIDVVGPHDPIGELAALATAEGYRLPSARRGPGLERVPHRDSTRARHDDGLPRGRDREPRGLRGHRLRRVRRTAVDVAAPAGTGTGADTGAPAT